MENERANKKLYRSRTDRIIFGVCGGLGKYFEVDSLIFRILFVLLVLGSGFGVLLYIILAIVIPSEPLPSGNPGEQNKENFGETLRRNANDLAQEIRGERNPRSARNVLGLLVIAFGLFLLVGNLFPRFVRWDLFWPLALLVVGLLIITRRRN
jgi:phage shock protein PspC (stress-responsive transcriptional regulator)